MTRLKYDIDIKRFSGFRLQFLEPRAAQFQWQQLVQQMQPFKPIIQAASQEPYWLDDTLRGMTPEQLLTNGLANGEFFAAIFEGKLVCIATVRDIFREHSGYFEGYSLPEFRTLAGRRLVHQVANEIADYAFAPFGEDGLGLIKLKAEVAQSNRPALCAMRSLHYKVYGSSLADALHHGQYQDTLHLELLNPAFFNAVQQGKSLNVQENKEPAVASIRAASSLRRSGSVREATGLRGAARSTDDSTAGAEPASSDAAGRTSRKSAAKLVAVKQKPARSKPDSAVRIKLRPPV